LSVNEVLPFPPALTSSFNQEKHYSVRIAKTDTQDFRPWERGNP